MNIICTAGVDEVGVYLPDVLVLPERTSIAGLMTASSRWPDAIVVGAVEENPHIRGYALKRCVNQIDYLKFSTDSNSIGTLDASSVKCTCESGDIALGVLICKDFQQIDLRTRVIERVVSSKARFKVVCIPADMGTEWFPNDSVQYFVGAYLAMSNNRNTRNPTRRRSFITGPNGVCLISQSNYESISFSAH